MLSLLICVVLLAAIQTAWPVLFLDQDWELVPEPIRRGCDTIRRR